MDGYWTNVLIFVSCLWTVFGIVTTIMFFSIAIEDEESVWLIPAVISLATWILAAVYCYMATGTL
jgi:hypothetical protein